MSLHKTEDRWVEARHLNWWDKVVIVELNDYITLGGCFIGVVFNCKLIQTSCQPTTWQPLDISCHVFGQNVRVQQDLLKFRSGIRKGGDFVLVFDSVWFGL